MDRALLVATVLAACGDDGGLRTLPDGPTVDTSPGTATVTVRAGRHPVASHTVYFQGPDSTELAAVQTDANGRASAVVPTGSSVTVVDPINPQFPNSYRGIKTIMGVKPGDELTLGVEVPIPQSDITFTFPPYPDVATARYSIGTQCGGDGVGEGSTHQLGQELCSPRVDTILYAGDASVQGDELAYLAKLDQPLVAGGTIDLSGETWQPLTTSTTTFTNIPYGERAGSYRELVTPRGSIAGCDDYGQGQPPTHTQTNACPTIPGVAVRDSVGYSDNMYAYEVSLLVTAPSSTVDLGATQVRSIAESPSLDVGTRTFSWTETEFGSAPEFIELTTSDATNRYNWYVIAPYEGTSLTMPTLVGDAAGFVLEPGSTPNLRLGAATGGYDALRPFGTDYRSIVSDEIERILTARPYDG